ncbi:hypothetical protein HPP92_018141 [Vanilla planifolia]|uniref:Kinesin motor domain-containing protein n=1 Tax=Vanilla planifolia TaxID=51239 RepID=A0A835QHG6_VANPL|nr:hypothetical protein HPP92_018141 [Vanilla planifolia]
MFKDLRIFRRNFGKNPTAEANNENLPACPDDLASFQLESDHSRPPLNTIQEPVQNPKFGSDQEAVSRRKNEQTPSKGHVRGHEAVFQFRTPEKATAIKKRFGWGPKGEEPGPSCTEDSEDSLQPGTYLLRPPPYPPASHLLNLGNVGGFCASTPRAVRAGGKASSVQSGTSSTQSTPTKSVTKPSINGNGSHRVPACGGTTRGVNLSVPCKGMPISSVSMIVYAPTEVPHFELKEDPSFWMEHNVQVVIRIRPLNTMEKNLQGYTRCIKQDNAQSITMIGQSDTRFIFDYVACETVNQEMLFRVAGLPIVENCISGYNSCVFAYGQTGSGKTYTMLGEINDMEITPSANRGMTPRIFEFLFARIRAEEESRRDEKLQYHCRCSFLEIYNEQITDLLDPSSTNLLIREDLRKGVYVENLTEFEVENVNDIIKLLIQGASNRKVAATNMNRESSRSHSVFTCTIESRWENDSTSNMRYARLNLVDLAGSERQKTSGAEGCRLKEAANINKSLSTLGHVIMVLADVASGRQRHIPYRDSRLTFLLQDSLGGNSKTMIIANVSPSVCSTNETLSTLKFAQRAKLIQNNAVVNENTSNDVVALQHQIHLLKEELSMLKRQNVSRSLSFYTAIGDVESNASSPRRLHCNQPSVDQVPGNEELCSLQVSTKKLKSLEATLAGALRREKMAEIATRELEAEIQQLNRLVSQREEDIQCSKMMIKFREDKVLRMEAVLNGLMSSESYESEENKALSKEISLLRAKVDRNPEVTRFALENIRLLEQLRKYQDFYEEGERELLLTEVSDLRNQLLQFLNGKSEQEQLFKSDLDVQEQKQLPHSNSINEEESLRSELKRVSLELDDCRNNLNSCLEINAKLTREINGLNIQLNKINHASPENNMDLPLAFPGKLPFSYSMKHTDEVLNLELELDILKTIIAEEKSYRTEAEERAARVNAELSTSNEILLKISKKYDETNDKLKDARSVIEALESQQVLYINELDELRQHNSQLENILKKQEDEISALRKQLCFTFDEGNKQVTAYEALKGGYIERECSPLQMKLKSMQASLEKAWNLNLRFQTDQESQTSNEREMDEVRRQVEAETAEVILCLQEELSTLHQLVDDSNKNELLAKQYQMNLETQGKELDDKVYQLTLENTRLAKEVEEKEQKLRSVVEDWEKLACEIADLLENGNGDLDIVTYEVASITDTFSHQRWIGEQFVKIIRGISERDSLVEELQKSLEDAQNVRHDMELKLRSLRGATLAISEAQQQESSDKESQILYLTSQLSEKMSVISELESLVELAKNQIRQADISAPDVHLLDRDYLQLKESEECILQKDSFMHDRVCHDLGTQLEQCYKQKDLVEQQQQALALNVQWKDDGNPTSFENSDDFMGAKMELEEFRMEMWALKSCINEYVENRSNTEEEEHSLGKQSCEAADFNSEEGLYKQKDLVDKQQQALALNVQWKDDGNPIALKNSDAFMEAKMELEEFQMETRALRSCINEYVENRSNTEEEEHNSGKHSSEAADFISEDRANIGSFLQLPESVPDRERTIIMLRGEIRSALDSLREVQCQMAQMFEEKDENRKAMMLSQDSIKCLRDEVHRLNAEVLHKENKFKSQLFKMEDELQAAKQNVVAFKNAKELLELEISNAKAVAAHKTMEATNLLLKIEEAQGAMQDAEVMVNALTEANEAAKVEIERLKQSEMSLCSEKCSLISQLHDLKASLDEKDESFECIQKYCKLNIMEANSLVIALEDQLMKLKDHFAEKISLITNDLQGLKSQMLQHKELASLCLEEIWLDSIGKDCALSVVCLCHLQVLLEQITDLNAENHFLRSVLCESNSLVSNLRQNYEKAQKEVHMCSILKGKLLLDINASFARITKSENETSELNAKLNLFEKKIFSLQLLEETMLEKSSSIGAELDILKTDYDAHKAKCMKRENEKINKLNEMMSLLLVDGQVTNEILRDKLDIELKEKFEVTKGVEQQLFDMNLLLTQRTYVLHDLQKEMECIKHKNVDLESHVSTLEGKLEITRALVEENKAIAAERLENLLMENKELERKLIEMSTLLGEVQETNETMMKNLSKASDENNIAIEMLEEELLETCIMLGQRDHLVEVLQKDLSRVAEEKDHLESAAYIWKEKLDIAITVTEVMVENEQLKLQLEEMKKMLDQVQDINRNLLEESVGNSIAFEILRKELLDFNILLGNKARLLQELQNEITEHTKVKQHLECQVSILKEKLEFAEACAEENEAIATEARQIAEDSKAYAVDKDEEIKLLETSVEELEFTVNALQEQVRIVKEEAERQRLKMGEFEMEHASVRHSEYVGNASDCGCADLSRSLEDKVAELESAQLNIQLLQKEVAEKEIEIAQCKSLIAELNLHAEAQAKEYKLKFQELEAMAVHVKSEQVLSNSTGLIPTKTEKGIGKSRGSGSPFKCIGLGVQQQINIEKDEELSAAKRQIEELEALAANRQKQIFVLNARLAAAESMTHDVLRDLLSIKLDMTKYAKVNERSQSENAVSLEKDHEFWKLKKQVDEFIEERQMWFDQINQQQKELNAAQMKLERVQEHVKKLAAENELLKVDSAKYMNLVMELEDELEKTMINSRLSACS